jgi:hypothetical protein
MMAGAAANQSTAFDTTLIGDSVWLDGSADFLKRTFGSASNQKRFVLGTWIQRNSISSGTLQTIFATGADGSNGFFFQYQNATSSRNDRINIYNISGGSLDWNIQTSTRFRDIAYYHILLSYESAASETDRVQIYINGVLQTGLETASYPSLNFDCDWGAAQSHCIGNNDHNTSAPLPAYLTQTIYLDGNSIQNSDVAVTDFLDAFTFGTNGSQFAPKSDAAIAALATTAGGNSFCLSFGSPFGGVAIDDSGSTKSGNMTGNGGLAAIFDGDTTKNNSEVGSGVNTSGNDSFVVVDHGSAKTVTKFVAYGSSDAEGLDGDSGGSTLTFTLAGSTDNFSSSNVSLFSGTVSDPGAGGTHTVSSGITAGAYRYHKMTLQTNTSNGGEQFGQLAELEYYEGNGLGTDSSDNNNHFVETSMSVANQSTNTPSKVYPTFNPLTQVGTSKGTFSEGNTKVSLASDNGAIVTTTLPSSGMWYWEIDWSSGANGIYPGIALQSAIGNTASSPHVRSDTFVWLAGDASGRAYNGSSLVSYVGSATSIGRIAVAFDADNTAMYFGTVSGSTITWLASGDPTSGASKTGAAPFTLPTDETLYLYQSTGSASISQYLFDEDDWTGVTNRPADAKSLNSANLSAPDYQGIDYFTSTLYEGNGRNQRVGDFVPFTDDFDVAFSAMFDDDDERFLSRTYTVGDAARSSNSQATISFWIKTCFASTDQDQFILSSANSAQTARFMLYINDQSGQTDIYMVLDPLSGSNKVFRIPIGYLSESEWINIVYNIDVDNGTAADKIKAWVNGVQVTSTDTTYQSASNADYFLFANEEHMIGNLPPLSAGYANSFPLNSYLAEFNVLDGQLKAPTDFGQVDTATNRWIPKDYETNVGAYGNRGFYMAFASPTGTGSGVGTDTSGNGFNFAEKFGEDGAGSSPGSAAWTTADQFIDTPTKNYATLDSGRAGSSIDLAQGNLKQTAGTDHNVQATMAIPKSGKWAFTANIDVLDFSFGIVSEQNSLTTKIGRTSTSWGIIESTGASLFNVEHNSVGSFNLGSQPSVNDKLIAAIDMDTNSLWLGYDTGSGFTYFGGGNPATGATPTYQGVLVTGQRLYFAIGRQLSVSFGGQSASLYGTLPTDFLELNQDNLDDTASKITAWAWIKNRDTTDNHMLFDRVRGVGNDIHSNDTAIEVFNANTVQRFLQRGVQVGSDVEVNTANESYVLWQWLVGDSATTGSTTAPAGSIASTSIVADAGHFSVGTYTGTGSLATIGHGLGGVPEFITIKQLNSTASWTNYHSEIGATKQVFLNLTNAAITSALYWNDTEPTSSVFTVNTDNGVNASSSSYVFYAFRSVAGVCKVGSYTGNGAADGPYISTGFEPSFIMIKRAVGGTGDWNILDTSREPFNAASPLVIRANLTTADEAGSIGDFDILSDGFKLKAVSANANTASSTYIYLAMADIAGNGTLPPVYGR